MMKYYVFALLYVLALRAANNAAAQSGFISIDCGLPEKSDYIDSKTGISYTSDSDFIDTGVSKTISPEYIGTLEKQFSNVRSFPQGTRNCYTLKPDQGKDGKYLIRARFLYGNYDAANKPPKFDVYLGLEYWITIETEQEYDTSYNPETIHIPQSDYINVCLVKTGSGTPFISSLELRPLDTKMYPTTPGFMGLYLRRKYNSITNLTIRYKDDIYDRMWRAAQFPSTTTLSTQLPIDTSTSDDYDLPQAAMSSAATPNDLNGSLSISWYSGDVTRKFHVYLHFTELQELNSNQSRQFDVYLNDVLQLGYYAPIHLIATTLHTIDPVTNATEYDVTIKKSINSTLPPIINAAEVYLLTSFSLPETIEGDVFAMSSIKLAYELTKNWQGDPCGPDDFKWDGVTCDPRDGFNPHRIVSLNLSSNGLNGTITSSILNLTMLQNLDLSNNNLNGMVPEFFASMTTLQVLNLTGNNFTSCPPELLEKKKQGKLQFSCDDRGTPAIPPTCQSDSCKENKENKKSVVPIVASIVGAILFVTVSLLIALFVFRRKKQRAIRKVNTESNKNEGIVESREIQYSRNSDDTVETNTRTNTEHIIVGTKSRQFTYHEVLSMTNNFQRVIGKGGFGTVYHGYVGKTQVAVKMLSQSSSQGYKEFQAEANLLLTIHHKNLTSLVGYCYEGTNMGIIYEYMANGNVEKHLLGKGPYLLTWEERLRIAIDAGQGLEYLHHGCIPPVVHRDVKTTNILLDEKFQAKLADFGLSRAFPMDDSAQVSTMVAGTPGYLDPEYYSTTRLTEKSDVYSFGIILLEIVTGRSALPRNNTEAHIITWISSELEKGDINKIIDPRLGEDYAINSVWKIVELAMACVARNSSRRPTMNSVVVEVKACLAVEINRNDMQPTDSIGGMPLSLESRMGPQAR